jgi:hypothetical protein
VTIINPNSGSNLELIEYFRQTALRLNMGRSSHIRQIAREYQVFSSTDAFWGHVWWDCHSNSRLRPAQIH